MFSDKQINTHRDAHLSRLAHCDTSACVCSDGEMLSKVLPHICVVITAGTMHSNERVNETRAARIFVFNPWPRHSSRENVMSARRAARIYRAKHFYYLSPSDNNKTHGSAVLMRVRMQPVSPEGPSSSSSLSSFSPFVFRMNLPGAGKRCAALPFQCSPFYSSLISRQHLPQRSRVASCNYFEL